MRNYATRLALLGTIALTTGCVYFNGIYNAKEAARNGDARARRGDDAGANTFYSASAASAETVLVRHPKSSWRSRALYLAGRSSALAGVCDNGIRRLDEYLALPVGKDSTEFNRARLARGVCELRMGRLPGALAMFDSLVSVRDRELGRQARLWAARAALAAKDVATAERYLQGMEVGQMAWELINASVGAREFTRAESLLVARAADDDYRDEVIGALREMLNAAEFDAAERVVRRFDGARIREQDRVAMHFMLGDYNLRAGHDSAAHRHLVTVRQSVGRDTNNAREAKVRLAVIDLRNFEALSDLDTSTLRQDSIVQRSPFARRVSEQMLFVRMLADRVDSTGASQFLAGEVARDTLRAPKLARNLFLRVARDVPNAPLVPTALYAAMMVDPDSGDLWRRRILVEHPESHVASWLRGEDPSERPDFERSATLLRTAWLDGIRSWADSLRKLRPRTGAGTQP